WSLLSSVSRHNGSISLAWMSIGLYLITNINNSLIVSIYQEFVSKLAARAAVGSVKYFNREVGTKSYMNQLSIAKSAFAFIKHIVFTEPNVGLERSDVSMLPKAGHFPQTTSIS